MWYLILFAVIFTLILVVLWMFGGLRETLGDLVNRVFPKTPIIKGDKVEIFLNGSYNRLVTITGVTADKLYVYDGRLDLPIDYRGRFYAIGVDTTDGSRLVYVKCRKYFRYVRAAEIVRNAFAIIDDEDMLPIDEDAILDEESEDVEEDSER